LSQFGTSQLLKTSGQKIVNDKGENIQLRGLGLGLDASGRIYAENGRFCRSSIQNQGKLLN
jgi:hypothetical protein